MIKMKQLLIGLIFLPLILSGCTQIQSGPGLEKCGIEQCHGFDVTCGSDIPEACTQEFRLEDTCRQFVSCETIQGQCTLIEDEKFETCKNCVEQCKTDSVDAFSCVNECLNNNN